MPTLPTTNGFPPQIEQGNSYSFIETLGQYPASQGWTAKLYINQGASTPTPVTATTTEVDKYLFALSAAFTGVLVPGNWEWAIYVSSGSQQATAKSGGAVILASLQVGTPLSAAQQMVASLMASLQSVQSQKFKVTNFNGQQKQIQEIKELQAALVFWNARVREEQEKSDEQRGIIHDHAIGTRFTPQTGYPYPRFGAFPWL